MLRKISVLNSNKELTAEIIVRGLAFIITILILTIHSFN